MKEHFRREKKSSSWEVIGSSNVQFLPALVYHLDCKLLSGSEHRYRVSIIRRRNETFDLSFPSEGLYLKGKTRAQIDIILKEMKLPALPG
jgi:hypothetical protein